VIVQLNFKGAWNFSTSIVNQEFADIAYSVGEVGDFVSTGFAIKLDLVPDGREFVAVTVIRINQKVVSTLDVELKIAPITFVKERAIVRSRTSITTITISWLERKGIVWV
jgi:hypothetical protein